MRPPIHAHLVQNFSILCSNGDAAGMRQFLAELDGSHFDSKWASTLLKTAVARASLEGVNALAPLLTRFDFNQSDDNLIALALPRTSTSKREFASSHLQSDIEMAALIARLVELGVNPNGAKNKSPTPLGMALRRNPAVALALIAHGAIPTPDDMREATLVKHPEILIRMLSVRSGPPSLLLELESLALGKKSSECLAAIRSVRERQELRQAAPCPTTAHVAPSRRL